jgi:TfoX/Sxy family transcriptional regulator of competence genes
MSTTQDFAEYVCEQIRDSGDVRYRKMFGEYMVYVNDKPILLVCDNTVFVKKIDALADLLKDADVGFPYTGAKEHYILDIDDAGLSSAVIDVLEPLTSVPAPKKKKSKK